MAGDVDGILSILDRCCDSYTFPMLDNGYVYLAATRLSLFRSSLDWAMVIEVFGFSPRSGLPDTQIQTFASRLRDRNEVERYVTRDAHEKYLKDNPNNDSRFVYPVEDGPWRDVDDEERISADATHIGVRGERCQLPPVAEYLRHGITLEHPPAVQVFEWCRWLAATRRHDVLASSEERRVSVLSEMTELLVLEEWRHPDVVADERPGTTEEFEQLAQVLVTGDTTLYRPSRASNTHWQHWPEGGRL